VTFYDFATKIRREIAETTALPVAWDSGVCLSPDEHALYFSQVDRFGSNIFVAHHHR